MPTTIQVLGPTRVVTSAVSVEMAARKLRGLVAALVIDRAGVVTADRLVDLLWGTDAPAGAFGTLHSYISGLRRILEPGLAPRATPTVLVSLENGYRLNAAGSDVDAHHFADTVRTHHRELAPLTSMLSTGPDAAWPARDRLAELVDGLEAALGTWRGTPYADLPDHPDVVAARAGLEEARARAEDDLVMAMLALGEHASTVTMTEQAVQRSSLRERSWSLHALALARSGRQAEALETIRQLRQLLDDELGIDPTPEVRALEEALLRQDAAVLDGWLRPEVPVVAPAAASAAPAPAATAAPEPVPTTGRAAVVGRDSEVQLLTDRLDQALAGAAVPGLLVGEAGIGKSTLLRTAAAEARERGFIVAVAPTSEDNDAPPLWPWGRLLAQLTEATGVRLPDVADLVARRSDDRATSLETAFEVRDALAHAVLDLARDRPLLLVFEDLHWADVPTLRAVTHLLARAGEHADEQPGRPVRLVVLGARRPIADPPPALHELEAVLARSGGLQLRVEGLDPVHAAELVGLVAGDEVRDLAPAWLARTGGNPFFLVELARLAATDPGWRGEVPASVQQVVGRRLADVAEESRELLVLAAALGESFSPLLLAAVAERPATEVQDLLEPAADVGIVREVGDGTVRFEHALTRDAVLAARTPTQLSRVHARIAHALEAMPRETRARGKHAFELARHWLAAGPVHAPSAWRAAASAAREAAALSAHREAADLLQSAVESHALDPFGTRREHLELLVELAGAGAAAARMPVVLGASKEAVALARVDGDARDVGRVAEALTRYSLWTPIEWGVVDDDLVDDLRWALRTADPADHPTRARLMLALAAQLYYDDRARAETLALVDEGTALVRRLDDPDLLCWASRAAHLALWRPGHYARMEDLARTELEAARATSNDESRCFALTTLAALAMIRGDRPHHDELMAEAFSLARRRRLPFALIGLCFVELCSAVARREDDAADALAQELLTTSRSTTVAAQQFLGIAVTLARGFVDDTVLAQHADTWLAIARSEAGRLQTATITGAVLARLGRLDDLRALAPLIPPVPDDWSTLAVAGHHAEVAAALGDPSRAAPVVELLRRHRAGITLSGIALATGPVAGYLALAEHALGNEEAAARAADEAVAVAEAWDYPAHVDWMARQRERYGF